MEQLLVRVYDVDFREFYAKYRDGQGEAFMSLVPPGTWKASTPPVNARMSAQAGVYAFSYEGLDGKTVCMLTILKPLYEAEAPSTIVRLYWDEEAANFASGFLDWLHGNFRTDAPQTAAPEAKSRKLEDVVLEAMRLYPDKQGRMSQAAWNYIFEHFERIDGIQPDYFAIAASTGKDVVTVRKASSRYEQHKRDSSHVS